MHTYIVTGTLKITINGNTMTAVIHSEVEAANKDAAITAALAAQQTTALYQDRQATVVWASLPTAERAQALNWEA